MSNGLSIAPAPPERATEILSLVFSHLSQEDRADRVETLLRGVRSGRVSLDGLMEARRGDRLVGGCFSEIQVGRTAVVWPPRLVPPEPESTARALLARTCELLAAKRTCLADALLGTGMQQDAVLLRAAGFEPLADLVYLVSVAADFPASRPESPLEFEPYSAACHPRLAQIVEATYQGTQDCPRLDGLRHIDDVLAGYRAIGVFAPSRWLLVRHHGRDVGCLLLADHPDCQNWELVYMGLVPSARGNGWGKDMARQAQWLAGRAGRPRLVLAVDAANSAAVRTYRLCGFERWDRRTAYLKVFEAAR